MQSHHTGGLSLDDLADAGAAIMRAVISSTRAFTQTRFTAR
jgi:hypothetical protein